mmetsp:Transcript_16025/g.38288  ORF Transcript_16025/g.38288 Transcript_16025/m.38288 type:complete len:284 (-) Transcript_16025:482-1333(-)|eukprot:2735568-Rhodomonas_salina.1
MTILSGHDCTSQEQDSSQLPLLQALPPLPSSEIGDEERPRGSKRHKNTGTVNNTTAAGGSGTSRSDGIKKGDNVLYKDKTGHLREAIVEEIDNTDQTPSYLINFDDNTSCETEKERLITGEIAELCRELQRSKQGEARSTKDNVEGIRADTQPIMVNAPPVTQCVEQVVEVEALPAGSPQKRPLKSALRDAKWPVKLQANTTDTGLLVKTTRGCRAGKKHPGVTRTVSKALGYGSGTKIPIEVFRKAKDQVQQLVFAPIGAALQATAAHHRLGAGASGSFNHH